MGTDPSDTLTVRGVIAWSIGGLTIAASVLYLLGGTILAGLLFLLGGVSGFPATRHRLESVAGYRVSWALATVLWVVTTSLGTVALV